MLVYYEQVFPGSQSHREHLAHCRKDEPADETEASFQRRVPRTVESYAQGSAKKLIPSMAARIEEVIEKKGGMAKY